MPILFSLAAAIIPMLLYLFIIWKMDKYEPEPLMIVFKHFLWGAFGAVFFGILGSELLSTPMSYFVFDELQFSLLQTVLVAPFVEEITKGIYLLRSSKTKVFDNLTDGLVYGGAIGLGFGMTENFLYFVTYGDSIEAWIYLVVVRSGFSAVMHCMSTATLGAFFGVGKYSKTGYVIYPLVGILIAMLIHFLWNFTVSFENTFLFGFLLLFGMVIIFFSVFRFSLRYERKIINEELAEEIKDGLFPQKYLPVLASVTRFRKGWIEENIRLSFMNNATKLAFRKRAVKKLTGKKQEEYMTDVIQFRNKIQELLKNGNHE